MLDLPGVVVPPEWLRRHLTAPDLLCCDVRWALATGAERPAYAAGHIPGAVFIDLDRELAGPPGPTGRHPLPDPAAFAAAMRRAGAHPTSTVVAYDAGTGAAARLWWLLRAAGHRRVAVLDGGFAGWLAAGGPVTTAVPDPAPGTLGVAGFAGTVDADTAGARAAAGTPVLDARAPERYRGLVEPIDPRPGHIPGARNLPWTELCDQGRLRPPAELRARFAACGLPAPPAAAPATASAAVAYCGSGVTAAALLLAMAHAGLPDGDLYPGSWSEWSRDPARPAATGPAGT
ncbi:MAG TPA: sulfurtransferase [Candidatus Dormibacteraeota bacterium]|nr:sulfurtransferase [Candidatus Dormibacteraeota bacterium]